MHELLTLEMLIDQREDGERFVSSCGALRSLLLKEDL